MSVRKYMEMKGWTPCAADVESKAGPAVRRIFTDAEVAAVFCDDAEESSQWLISFVKTEEHDEANKRSAVKEEGDADDADVVEDAEGAYEDDELEVLEGDEVVPEEEPLEEECCLVRVVVNPTEDAEDLPDYEVVAQDWLI